MFFFSLSQFNTADVSAHSSFFDRTCAPVVVPFTATNNILKCHKSSVIHIRFSLFIHLYADLNEMNTQFKRFYTFCVQLMFGPKSVFQNLRFDIQFQSFSFHEKFRNSNIQRQRQFGESNTTHATATADNTHTGTRKNKQTNIMNDIHC